MAENSPLTGESSSYSLEQVDEIIANRAIIEQAKGILMLVHGIDADHAFDLLRTRSRSSQVKLLLVAERLVEHVSALTTDARLDVQAACGELPLFTAQTQVGGVWETE